MQIERFAIQILLSNDYVSRLSQPEMEYAHRYPEGTASVRAARDD